MNTHDIVHTVLGIAGVTVVILIFGGIDWYMDRPLRPVKPGRRPR